MRLLKNRTVAVIVLIFVIVLSSLYGLSKRPEVTVPDGAAALDESLSTAWLNQYVQDNADVLASKTEKLIAVYDANWDNMFGGILAVVTERSVPGDIEDAAWDWAEDIGPDGLGENDAILLIDAGAGDYRLIASGAFYDLLASQGSGFVDNCMADYVWSGDYDGAVTSLLGQIHLIAGSSYQSSAQALSVFGTLFTVVLLIVFLVVLFSILDGIRYSMWYGRYGTMVMPPVVYRPILWWHRPGSRWFNDRRRPPRPPRPPMGGPRPPMGGGPRPPMSGGPRPPMGSGPRPPMSGGPRSGSFGGGSRPGSFGGPRSGSFGGPATGGHSRGGSFGGGSRGGSFGGGSRGGGFGGRR